MLSVVSALLAFVASLFRSRVSLRLEHPALGPSSSSTNRLTLGRDSVRPIACSGSGYLGSGPTGILS
jgi:hypothetical protein